MAVRPPGPPSVGPEHAGDGAPAAVAVAFLLALWLAPLPALAQVQAGASVQSDYRLRGFTLTDRRPAASLNLAYDDPSGAYAGGTLVGAATRDRGVQFLGHIEYVGYAHRLGSGRALDVGVQHTNLTSYAPGRENPVHYTELYAGISDQVFSLRLHYAPNYIRPHVEVLYLDANAVFRPIHRWRVFGHLGVSQTVAGPVAPGAPERRYDIRAGLAREIPHGDLSLEWTTTGPTVVRPGGVPPSTSALIVGLSLFLTR